MIFQFDSVPLCILMKHFRSESSVGSEKLQTGPKLREVIVINGMMEELLANVMSAVVKCTVYWIYG